MSAEKLSIALVAVAAAVLTAAAGSRLWHGAAPEGRAAALVPETADLYVNVYVDPSNGQKRALRDLLGTEGDTVAGDIEALFDPVFETTGIDFEEDIDPWLGREVALFHQSESFGPKGAAVAVLVETTDLDAARELARSVGRSRFDATVIEDFLVIGNESGVLAVRGAHLGSRLSISPQYEETSAVLPTDRVVTIYARHEFSGNRPSALDDDRDAAALYFAESSVVLEGTFDLWELLALPGRLREDLGGLIQLASSDARSVLSSIGSPRLSFGSVERDGETLDQVVFSFR